MPPTPGPRKLSTLPLPLKPSPSLMLMLPLLLLQRCGCWCQSRARVCVRDAGAKDNATTHDNIATTTDNDVAITISHITAISTVTAPARVITEDLEPESVSNTTNEYRWQCGEVGVSVPPHCWGQCSYCCHYQWQYRPLCRCRCWCRYWCGASH